MNGIQCVKHPLLLYAKILCSVTASIWSNSSTCILSILSLIIIVTSGPSNLTEGCAAATHGRFSSIHQVAPMCTPHTESQIMVAMAMSLSCSVSAISAFCWSTTQTLGNQLPSRCRSQKASSSNFSPKTGCRGNNP